MTVDNGGLVRAVKVQAASLPVSASGIRMSPSLASRTTRACTVMSAGSQGPSGWASTRFFLPGVAVGVLVAVVVRVGVWSPAACSAVPPASDLPSLPLPSTRAIPNTSRKATARTTARRVQYTRGGKGPRGRATPLMAQTLTSTSLVTPLQHSIAR